MGANQIISFPASPDNCLFPSINPPVKVKRETSNKVLKKIKSKEKVEGTTGDNLEESTPTEKSNWVHITELATCIKTCLEKIFKKTEHHANI